METTECVDTVETPLKLTRMRHQNYVRGFEEDWAGVGDPHGRKKRQNRLNQRALRQRRKMEAVALGSPAEHRCADRAMHPVWAGNSAKSTMTADILPRPDAANTAIDTTYVVARNSTDTEGANDGRHKRGIIESFARVALESHKAGQPNADHLLRLIQLNVVNALSHNSKSLEIRSDWLICSSISPFGQVPQLVSNTFSYPMSLAPTELQLKWEHHPWVDLLPLPQLRTNFLIATLHMKEEAESELWQDFVEFKSGEWTGMIAWGEPWDPYKWEVTDFFWRKWGWLLQGCPELLIATNYWRRLRGDAALRLEHIIGGGTNSWGSLIQHSMGT